MLRRVRSVIMALALVALGSTAGASAQDRAADLASPWPGAHAAEHADESAEPDAPPEVLADGHARDIGWADPELDLEPRQRATFVLAGTGGWFGAGAQTADGGFADLRLFADVCLEPTVSLHVRLGVGIFARITAELPQAGAPDGGSRAAVVGVRGLLLVGVHLFQLVAVRAGAELGEGYAVFGGGAIGALGGAFVSQAGVRFAGGRMEAGIEVAAALVEGATYVDATFAGARGIHSWVPRLGVIAGGTF